MPLGLGVKHRHEQNYTRKNSPETYFYDWLAGIDRFGNIYSGNAGCSKLFIENVFCNRHSNSCSSVTNPPKHIWFYTVFLLISGILFLVSGVIEQAYETIVNPLPVLSQIEFSKTMRPQQISCGLWNIGIGIIYMLSVAGYFRRKYRRE